MRLRLPLIKSGRSSAASTSATTSTTTTIPDKINTTPTNVEPRDISVLDDKLTSSSQVQLPTPSETTSESRPSSTSRHRFPLSRQTTAEFSQLPSNAPSPLMQRNIWVRRPNASSTRVKVNEDDLVDDVRVVILHKYANSLGRNIDAPDITLKILTREQNNKNIPSERALGPEESISQTLDTYYPGGQTIDEALIIEVPRRTPRPSPRVGNHTVPYYYADEYRPSENARDYFSPMPLQSPHLAPNSVYQPSMSVLTTGQLPPLPSPGAQPSRRSHRPKYGRQHTSSPTILHTTQPSASALDPKNQMNGIDTASNPPLPTPPMPLHRDQHQSITPPNRTASPHAGQQRNRRSKNPHKPSTGNLLNNQPNSIRSVNGDPLPPKKPASAGLLDGNVPPIQVLIVEDNVINLKVLEAIMKRLKVRWKSAMNGKEAVAAWRTGGFHLVLMDIQMPVMNGLDATKEIRRLEGVNGIGVFSGSPVDGRHSQPQSPAQIKKVNGDIASTTNGDTADTGDIRAEDQLSDLNLFKSPVIVVALTASSLQSDRHEALAAGCNDFLTKPVTFLWMERKVTEWGCMQALIDFDGWKKWKAIAAAKDNEDPAEKAKVEKDEKAKTRAELRAMFARGPPTKNSAEKDKDKDKEKEKKDDKDTTTTTNTSLSTTTPANGTPIVSGAVKASKPPSPLGGLQQQQLQLPQPGGNPGHKRRGGNGSLGQIVGAGGGTMLPSTPEGDEE